MTNIKIAVAYHKKCQYVSDEVFIPVQVGAVYNPDLGIQKDSQGENISLYNPYCCEMSATYWLWKNITNADYYGLCHYRRFFSYEHASFRNTIKSNTIYYAAKCLSPFLTNAKYTYSHSAGKVLEEHKLNEILLQLEEGISNDIDHNNIECFCLKKTFLSTISCELKLQHCIGILNYIKLNDIIKEINPNFYTYFKKTMHGNSFYPCNMIIFAKKYFDDYCENIFPILSKYHEHITDGMHDGAINKVALRTSGYISEYLTSTYISMLLEQGIKVETLYTAVIDLDSSGLSLGMKKDPLLQRIKEVL